MADPATPTGDLPPLSPQSRRIQAALSHFGVARMLGAAQNPLAAVEPLDIAYRPIGVLQEENLISRVAATVREIERPSAMDEWMATCTAQFILRNTHRATRDDARPDAMQFDHVPRNVLEPAGAAVAALLSVGRQLETDSASERLTTYVAQRAQLMVEPWPDHFGRPDPADVQESS
ncbi:MAG: hypothetical protein ACI9U2_000297 [Bradymonadia bacterium]|jgi:hypothetical protein